MYLVLLAEIFIYSIDRDIGMIGLPLDLLDKQVIVQFRARFGNEKYLHLCPLQSAISKDSDLADSRSSRCSEEAEACRPTSAVRN